MSFLRYFTILALLQLFIINCVSKKKFLLISNQNIVLNETVTRLKSDSTALQKRIDVLKKEQTKTVTTYNSNIKPKNPTTISQDEVYKSKALYIFNFTRNVTWPSKIEGDFQIAVLKNALVYDKILNQFIGKTVGNSPVKVSLVSTVDEAKSAELVYVPQNQSASIDQVISKCSRKKTLIITENDEFANLKCNCINLTMDGNNVEFQVDESTLKANGFGVAATLLQLEGK